jgi:hypothetical protein
MLFSFGDDVEFEQYILGFKPARHFKESLWAHTLGHLKQFNLEHPTDADCVESIYRRMDRVDPFTCVYCGCQQFNREFGARKGRCAKCNKVKNFTAQSDFFKGMKSPRAYCGMLYLIEHGCFFNAHQVAPELKISRGSSWELQRELDMAMHEAITSGDINDFDTAFLVDSYMRRSSATPAYEAPFTEQEAMEKSFQQKTDGAGDSKKREPGSDSEFGSDFDSNSAPNSNPDSDSDPHPHPHPYPHSDSDLSPNLYECLEPDGGSDFLKSDPVEGDCLQLLPSPSGGTQNFLVAPEHPHLSDFQQRLYSVIGSDPVSFDALLEMLDASVSELLSALTMLELDDLIVNISGQTYQRNSKASETGRSLVTFNQSPGDRSVGGQLGPISNISSEEGEKLKALITSFRAFIRVLSQGTSRKYIQLYLSRFCFLLLLKKEANPVSLFGACLQLGEVSRTELKAFVSSLKIRFASALYCI